jgi:pyruvate dehydrogenase E2 component (dihydrolipoyllysine-residue acetyltransferase)
MSINITMPALSPTMEEGKLAKWHVKEGDSVSSGDVIAEIETDKATMEVEAVDEGKIGKIVVPEGTDNVKVNAVIAVLLTEGESAADVKTPAPAPKPAGSPSPASLREAPSPRRGEGKLGPRFQSVSPRPPGRGWREAPGEGPCSYSQRPFALSSTARCSTQRSPDAVASFFQKGASVLR